MSIRKAKTQYKILLSSRDKIKAMVLIHRQNPNQTYKFDVLRQVGTHYEFAIDTTCINWRKYYWDGYAEIEGDKNYARIAGASLILRLKLDFFYKIYAQRKDGKLLYPYLTSKSGFSINYRDEFTYDKTTAKIKLLTAIVLYPFAKLYVSHKNILLLFEKHLLLAGDSAWFLFEKLKKYPQYKSYYVYDGLDEDIRRYKGVTKPYTLKFFLILLSAKLTISTESKAQLSNLRMQNSLLNQVISIKKHLFLQHGVLGLKRVDDVYHKECDMSSDYFVVSTVHERQIVHEYFGYDYDDIILSGLVRWEAYNPEIKEQSPYLLYLPTWRKETEGIDSEVQFKATNFFKGVKDFVDSDFVRRVCDERNLEVVVRLHPKLRHFQYLFQNDSSELHEVIKKADYLITDYSSVAWDFVKMGKHVLLYQFDCKQFSEEFGFYINPQEEFEYVVTNIQELEACLVSFLDNDYKMEQLFQYEASPSDTILTYIDTKLALRELGNDYTKNRYLKKLIQRKNMRDKNGES
jgi:hypothetical protein